MARTRKSHKADEEKAKTSSGIEPAYSSRVDGHKYVIYVMWRKSGEEHSRVLVEKFLATYAAQWFVNKIILSEEYIWRTWEFDSSDMIETSSGITIRAHKAQMKEIMEYEPNELERAWRDDHLLKSILRFKYGSGEIPEADGRQLLLGSGESGDEREDSDDRPDTPQGGRHSTPKFAGPASVKKGPRPERPARADTSGHTSANDIASSLGCEGREIRGILRALKLEKPAHGWSWPKKEAEGIEAQIKKALKELKKKKGK